MARKAEETYAFNLTGKELVALLDVGRAVMDNLEFNQDNTLFQERSEDWIYHLIRKQFDVLLNAWEKLLAQARIWEERNSNEQ